MAKRLLLNALLNALGDFVDGLNPENLKLGIWSGEISLRNVRLNVDALRKLDLPVDVRMGSIDVLDVKIPWSSLTSKPVQVHVSGVFLLVGPLDVSDFDTKKAIKHSGDSKHGLLNDADKKHLQYLEFQRSDAAAEAEEESAHDPGWVQRLISKIVDNIEISVERVHIRYEQMGTEGKVVGTGITIESFGVTSCDENWEKTFVNRDAKQTRFHKLGTLQSFAVYFDTDAQRVSNIDEMGSLVARTSHHQVHSVLHSNAYMIAPLNMKVKAVRNENPHGKQDPSISAQLEMNTIKINIRQPQYHQAMGIKQSFDRIQRCTAIMSHPDRPLVPVLKKRGGNPTAWWSFFTALLCKKRLEPQTRGLMRIKQKLKAQGAISNLRDTYIQLCKRLDIKIKQFPELGLEPLEAKDREILVDLERVLPVVLLNSLRQRGNVQLENQARLHQAEKESKKSRGWFGWGRGKQVDAKLTVEAGDLSIDEIAHNAQQAEQRPLAVRLSTTGGYELLLSDSSEQQIMSAAMRVNGAFVLDTNDMTWTTEASFQGLQVLDHYTSGAQFTKVVSTIEGPESQGEDDFRLNAVNEGTGTQVVMRARALQLVYNKPFVFALMEALKPPPGAIEYREIEAVATLGMEAVSGAVTNAFESTQEITLDVQAGAPKIIIPVDARQNGAGCLLLDAGQLKLQGRVGGHRMVYDVQLSDVRSRMADTYEDLLLSDSRDGALLERFSVTATARVGGASRSVSAAASERAEVDVLVRIDDPIRGVLSPDKLNDLLFIAMNAPKPPEEFAGPPLPVSGALRHLYNDEDGIPKTMLSADGAQVEEADPEAISLYCLLFLSGADFTLTSPESSETDLFTLQLSEVQYSLQNRLYDMTMFVELEGLRIVDQIRLLKQPQDGSSSSNQQQKQFLLYSEGSDDAGDGRGKLIRVDVAMINDRRSPLHEQAEGNDMLVDVAFARLFAQVDASALVRFKPYYAALLAVGNAPSHGTAPLSASTGSTSTVMTQGGGAPPSAKRMRIKLAMESVSAMVLHEGTFDPVLQAEVSGLATEVCLAPPQLECDVTLRSFSVSDVRRVAQERYVLNQLIAPAASHELRHKDKGGELAGETRPLLVLKYSANSDKRASLVDVTVNDFRSYVIVPSILASIDVSLELTKGILTMLAKDDQEPVNTRSIEDGDDASPEQEQSTQQQSEASGEEKTTMSVVVNVVNPALVLVEDPGSKSSAGVVLHTDITLNYDVETTVDSSGAFRQESIGATLRELEAFVDLDLSRSTRLHLLDPTRLVAAVHLSTHDGFTFKQAVDVRFEEPVHGRVSYADLMLILSILNRLTMPELGASTTGEDEEEEKDEVKEREEVLVAQQSSALHVKVHLSEVVFEAIDDAKRGPAPLLRFTVEGSDFDLAGTLKPIMALQGTAGTALAADFFNPELGEWEALLERWPVRCQLKLGNHEGLRAELSSQDRLRVVASQQTLSSLLDAACTFQAGRQTLLLTGTDGGDEDDAALAAGKEAQHRREPPPDNLLNESGCLVRVSMLQSPTSEAGTEQEEEGEVMMVHPGDGQSFPETGVTQASRRELASKAIGVETTQGRTCRVTVRHDTFADRRADRPLVVNGAGSGWLRLDPLEEQGKARPQHDSRSHVLEEVWEQQRRNDLQQRWGKPFMPGDPPHWTDGSWQTPRAREDVQLPEDGNWVWLNEWSVQPLPSQAVGRDIDEEGWQYGSSWNSLQRARPEDRQVRRDVDGVRRRRWTRVRSPRPPSLKDTQRPLALHWEARRDQQTGQQLSLTLSSGIRVVNCTATPLEVGARSVAWTLTVSCGAVEPGETFYLPLAYQSAVHLVFREALPGEMEQQQDDRGWPNTGVPIKAVESTFGVEGRATRTTFLPADKGTGADVEPSLVYQYVDLMDDSLPANEWGDRLLTIELSAPVRLLNHLPCPMQYSVQAPPPSKQQQPVVLCSGSLASGASQPLERASHWNYGADGVRVAVQFGEYDWASVQVSTSRARVPQDVELHATTGRTITVKAVLEEEDGGALTLELYAPFWVVDRTAERLSFGHRAGVLSQLTVTQPFASPRRPSEDEPSSSAEGGGITVKHATRNAFRAHLLTQDLLTRPVYTDVSQQQQQSGAVLSWGRLLSAAGWSTRVSTRLQQALRGKGVEGSVYVLSTPNAERRSQGRKLVSFVAPEPVTVVLLRDSRASGLPLWLLERFTRSTERVDTNVKAGARPQTNDPAGDFFANVGRMFAGEGNGAFTVFTSDLAAGEKVTLGGNNTQQRDDINMYIAIILPNHAIDEVTSRQRSMSLPDGDHACESWALGENGMHLYSPKDEHIVLALPKGSDATPQSPNDESSWHSSEKLSLGKDATRTDRPFSFKVDKRMLELCMTVTPCPGAYHRSSIIRIFNKFCFVNAYEDEDLFIKQEGTVDSTQLRLKPKERGFFHWSDASLSHKRVLIRTTSTQWSYGGLSINQVGSIAVWLAPAGNTPPTDTASFRTAHVEVRLSEEHHDSATNIVVWSDDREADPLYKVKNTCKYPIAIQQPIKLEGHRQLPKDLRWIVNPGEECVFGWIQPHLAESRKLTLAVVDEDDKAAKKHESGWPFGKKAHTLSATDTKKVSTLQRDAVAGIVPISGTRVVYIARSERKLQAAHSFKKAGAIGGASLDIALQLLEGVDLSLVSDSESGVAYRREIMVVSLDKVRAKYTRSGDTTQLRGDVGALQVDNHISSTPYPVFVAPHAPSKEQQQSKAAEQGSDEAVQAPESFFMFSFGQQIPEGGGGATFPYVGLRVLPMDVFVDLQSLQKLVGFFIPIAMHNPTLMTAEREPTMWIRKLSTDHMTSLPEDSVDFVSTFHAARSARSHFEHLEIHPIALRLTFQRGSDWESRLAEGNHKGRALSSTVIQALANLASVQRAPLQLECFLVEDAIEPFNGLFKVMITHYTRQVLGQLLSLAGSMAALGNPVDLASNVGGGVKSFFYEPAQGLVLGPKEFIQGGMRGTGSLVSGVLHGVTSSMAGVGTAMNRNLTLLTFDEDFQADRERMRNSSNTIGGGFKNAGQSVFGGFADGVTGVFTAPVQGARKSGIGGFVSGIGKGVAGLAVKPVVGITDGVVSVVQGASNSTSNDQVHAHLRPRRAIPLQPKNNQMVLVPYDEAAAIAQSHIELDKTAGKLSVSKHKRFRKLAQSRDAYVGHVVLDGDLLLIFSLRQLMLRHGSEFVRRSWKQIVNCTPNANGIMVNFYAAVDWMGKHDTAVGLPCSGKVKELVYSQLLAFRHHMGDPRGMPTSLQSARMQSTAPTSHHAAEAGQPEPQRINKRYVFGSVNGTNVTPLQDSSEAAMIKELESELCRITPVNATLNADVHRRLDLACWSFVHRWHTSHNIFNSRKIALLLILNESSTKISFTEPVLAVGQAVEFVHGGSYDTSYRSLMPGGAAVVLCYSFGPNPFKKQHAVGTVSTSAAELSISDMPKKTFANAKPSFSAGMLEHSAHAERDWVKVVVAISSN